MQVVLLGTGSADGWPNPFCACGSCRAARDAGTIRGQTAALVDDVLLLDCGPEAPRAAARAGRTLDRVTDVLLTHSHPDHTGPAALLWRSWARVAGPLTVHGPAEALELCRPWVGPDDPVAFHEVAAGDEFRTSHHRVRALAATHGDAGSGPGLLWDLTDADGNRLLYATDTGWPTPDTLRALDAAEAYDVVLLEETFGDEDDLGPDHLGLPGFGELVTRMRVRGAVDDSTQVVAVHLGHHNPPPQTLAARLSSVGARAGTDGEVLTAAGDQPAARTGRVTLVLGGARSGKSTLAESLADACPSVTYVATGGERPDDPEWTARVAAHRARRPLGWTTVETTDLEPALDRAEPGGTVLVDCLTLWLTDRLDRAGAWARDEAMAEAWRGALAADVDGLLAALLRTSADVVLVSNEVGQGVVPATPSGRVFQDEQGRLNARVADLADRVVLVVAGRPLVLKGRPW